MRRRWAGRNLLAFTYADHALIAVAAVLGVLVVLLATFLVPPRWAATTLLDVGRPAASGSATTSTTTPGTTPPTAPGGTTSTASDAALRAASLAALATSPPVTSDAAAMASAPGGAPLTPTQVAKAVTAEAVGGTAVVRLDVTAASPQEAQALSGAVTTALTRLAGVVDPAPQPAPLPPGASPAQVAAAEATVAPPVTVVAAPTVTGPTGPAPWWWLLVGLVVGAVVGVALALLRRWSRRSVESRAALGDRLGVRVSTHVPALRRRPRQPALLADPPIGTRGLGVRTLRTRAESVRLLRSGLWSAGDPRCVLLTGAGGGQATSTTATDLAVAYALTGESVVLVEADLRRPVLAFAFGLDGDRGLSDVLDGRRVLDEAVQTWAPGTIDVLPAGTTVAFSDVLFTPARIGPLLATLRSRYDRVVVDAPPAAATADTADLGRHTDGAVLVCRRGVARPRAVDATADALRTAGVPVLATVLTFAVGVTPAPVDLRRLRPVERAAETEVGAGVGTGVDAEVDPATGPIAVVGTVEPDADDGPGPGVVDEVTPAGAAPAGAAPAGAVPDQAGVQRGDDEQAAADRADAERVVAALLASQRAREARAQEQRDGAERAGAEQHGAEQNGAEQADAGQVAADGERTDIERADIERVDETVGARSAPGPQRPREFGAARTGSDGPWSPFGPVDPEYGHRPYGNGGPAGREGG